MDALVKAALERVNETVNEIPWTRLVEKREWNPNYNDEFDIRRSFALAINAVDSLKSALKTIRWGQD